MENNTQAHNYNTPTIKQLREALASTIGQQLASEGFSIDKKLTGLKKKVGKKNRIDIKFDCYDFKPSHIEFSLLFIFVIAEIDEEADKYYSYCNEQYNKGCTIILREGDFHPKVKHLDSKLRNAATHIVTDVSTMEEAIADSLKLLNEVIVPLLPMLSTLTGFQEFILNDYSNIIKLSLIVPALITAKLRGREELERMKAFLWTNLELESKSPQFFMRRLVENIIPYSELSFA